MSVIKTHESKSFYTRPRERKTKNRARLAKKKKKKKSGDRVAHLANVRARACVVPSSALGRSRFLVLARDRSRSLYEATKFFLLIVEEGHVKKKIPKKKQKGKKRESFV